MKYILLKSQESKEKKITEKKCMHDLFHYHICIPVYVCANEKETMRYFFVFSVMLSCDLKFVTKRKALCTSTNKRKQHLTLELLL